MFSRLLNAVTWLLVAGSVAIILGGLFGRPVLLAAVPTGSMLPTLQPGDMIPVIPLWGSTPQVGQVVVFKTENDETWIVHRVVAGNEFEGFVTRGDNNSVDDPYPVFARHIVGIVPQMSGRVLRAPQMGSLSLERGPLANPAVAGLAMIVGVYLLITDAGTGLRKIRVNQFRRMRMSEPDRKTTLAVYAGLAVAVFFVTMFTTWSMGSKQVGRFQVVAQKGINVSAPDMVVAGQPKSDEVVLENVSPIPLIVALSSNHPDARWDQTWVTLPPQGSRTVLLTIDSKTLGEHTVELRQAIYLPLLPTVLLQGVAQINWYLPGLATAVVPVLLVWAVAQSDPRVKLQLRHIRLALQVHLRM